MRILVIVNRQRGGEAFAFVRLRVSTDSRVLALYWNQSFAFALCTIT